MNNLTYTLPSNIKEWYIKGIVTLESGGLINFEIPGIFNKDGSLDEENSIAEIDKFIQIQNIVNRK